MKFKATKFKATSVTLDTTVLRSLFLTKCYEQKIDELLKSEIGFKEIDKLIIDTNKIIFKLTLNKSKDLEHTIILKNILEKLKFKKRLLIK